MSSIQTTDWTHESQAEIPLDATFWQTVAAHQAADDAENEAFDSEVNKPYRLSAP
jgi:hypothetical protein